jgi:serine/threonine-protein kinase
VEREPARFAQYLRELQISRRLDHPGLLKYVSIDEEAKSRPYLVAEYLEGQSLQDEPRRPGASAEKRALEYGAELCDALDYLHRQHIVHADVKPGNIVRCLDGSLRIIDFGIARFLATGGFPAHVGTPEYMAPEQVAGKRGDARTDVYALGAVLYEMVTGHVPFDNEPEDDRLHARLVGDPLAPSRYVPSLSPQVEEIILHALARKPRDRYPSAAIMKADLEAPERVAVSGWALRLQAPVLAKLWLPVAALVGLSLLAPVVLFFVFLALLRK